MEKALIAKNVRVTPINFFLAFPIFFFFLKREKPQGRLQQKRPLSGVLKRMVFSPNHFTEAKQTNTKS